jgi:hypothetical protein
MKLVGEDNLSRTYKCVDCGTPLWGDGGYIKNNKVHCVREDRCQLRQSRATLDAMAAQGLKPRWR